MISYLRVVSKCACLYDKTRNNRSLNLRHQTRTTTIYLQLTYIRAVGNISEHTVCSSASLALGRSSSPSWIRVSVPAPGSNAPSQYTHACTTPMMSAETTHVHQSAPCPSTPCGPLVCHSETGYCTQSTTHACLVEPSDYQRVDSRTAHDKGPRSAWVHFGPTIYNQTRLLR